jgi:L-ascorbate metabolism protein UlaG (beta-lactamase superfamily)
MRKLSKIDVAFVCMNLPYTMTPEQAASAVLEFKPKVVYPYHYRGQDTAKFKELVEKGGAGIEVRLRDWYGK